MYKNFVLFLNRHRGIIAILCLGLLIRLIYFLIILHNFGSSGFYLTANGDAAEYFALAKQWLSAGVYQKIINPGEPEIFRMPGLPLFIAFFYRIIPDAALPILAQNVIFVAFIGIFYKFARSLFNEKAALLASGFLALEPSIIYWNSQLITESLFTVIVFLSVYAAYFFILRANYRYAVLSGVLLAAAIYTRPAGEYLSVIFLIYFLLAFLLRKIKIKKVIIGAMIFLIGFWAPLYPWMARNKAYFGHWGVSHSSNIGFGKYLTAISERTGEEEDVAAATQIQNRFEKVAAVRKKFASYVVNHPLIFAKVYFLSIVPFLFGDSYISVFGMIAPGIEKGRALTDWKGTAGELWNFLFANKGATAVFFYLGKLVWGAIILFAFLGVGVWLAKYRRNYESLAFFILLTAYFALASGIGSYSRFRFPVNPYIFLLSALGIGWLIKKFGIEKRIDNNRGNR